MFAQETWKGDTDARSIVSEVSVLSTRVVLGDGHEIWAGLHLIRFVSFHFVGTFGAVGGNDPTLLHSCGNEDFS